MEVDRDILQAALARAVTEAVTPELQKEVFAQALTRYLFNTDGRGNSTLSQAFEAALREATQDVAKQVVRDNMPAIAQLMQAAFDKFVTDPGTPEMLVTLFSRGFPRY